MYPPTRFARCFNVRVSTFECRDLVQYGLVLTPSYDPLFDDLFRRLGRATQFAAPPDEAPEFSAILQNESGKIVIAWTHFWRYTDADRRTTTSTTTNLGSSMQMDILAGVGEPTSDGTVFFLPGSKRLITPEGTFGDNSDVVDFGERRGGFVGAGGGGAGAGSRRVIENAENTTLLLDGVFFHDRTFAGQDETGVFDAMTELLQRQRARLRKWQRRYGVASRAECCSIFCGRSRNTAMQAAKSRTSLRRGCCINLSMRTTVCCSRSWIRSRRARWACAGSSRRSLDCLAYRLAARAVPRQRAA